MSWLALLIWCTAAQAGAEFAATPEGEVALDLDLELGKAPQFTWAADPFLKTPGLAKAPENTGVDAYQLQAVTFAGEDPVAVVNDRVVRVGDRVQGRMVVKIGQDFVLLERKGSIVEASLYEESKDGEGRSPASAGAAKGAAAPKAAAPEGEVKIEEVKK